MSAAVRWPACVNVLRWVGATSGCGGSREGRRAVVVVAAVTPRWDGESPWRTVWIELTYVDCYTACVRRGLPNLQRIVTVYMALGFNRSLEPHPGRHANRAAPA